MTTWESIQSIIDEQDAQIEKLNSDVALLAKKIKPKQTIFINTHLFSDPVYSDIELVVKLLADIGITKVRQDFNVDLTGKMLQHDLYVSKIQPKFAEAGITVRPMLYTRGLKLDGNILDNQKNGQTIVNGFLKLYQFDEIELGNEMALVSLKAGMQGDKLSHYDSLSLSNTVAFVQGMYEACLTFNTKIIINTEWLHQYYIDALRSVGVNSFISLHMYTDGYDNAAKIKGKPIWEYLKDKYGAMFIEIGETNYMPPLDGSFSEQAQVDRFIPVLTQLLSTGLDIGLFELLDRVNSKGREGNLGFYKADGTAKLIVGEIKKLLYF